MNTEDMPPQPPRRFDVLEMFVIYDHPKDYPDFVVLRVWSVHAGRVEPGISYVEKTIEACRRHLPNGAINIGRQPGDDPVIVEVWV